MNNSFYSNYIKLVSTILLSTAFLVINAQDLSKDFKPVKSSGKLPLDFTESATSKALSEMEQLTKKYGKEAKEKGRFIISSAFFLDNLLKSGSVLYGDPISAYVNKVAKEILRNDKTADQSIRVYVIKSTVVNAYALDNGVIFVTTGLLSKLSNEAQLAFVLCHEMIHVKKKHAINAHVEFTVKQKKKSYLKNSLKSLLQKSSFNKAQESEADKEGLAIFLKTKYDLSCIDGLFDVLKYSYLPFKNVAFDKTFFNDKYLSIPNSYFLDSTRIIASDENTADSLSSHPNIKTRKEAIELQLNGKKTEGEKLFIVSETDFLKIRDLARFETCRAYMQNLEYPNAIYAAYSLLEDYPDNIYLQKVIARSLYQMAVYKSLYKGKESTVDSQLEYTDSIQGASQQVYTMLNKMTPTEITVLALKRNWRLHEKLAYKDSYCSEICTQLMTLLKNEQEIQLADFSDTISNPKKHKAFADSSFAKVAFGDLVKENLFTKAYSSVKKNEKVEPDFDMSDFEHLGVDKIIVVDPTFIKVDERKKQDIQYFTGEIELEEFTTTLKEVAYAYHIDYELLTPNNFTEQEIEKYNDLSMINDWVSERFAHGDFSEPLVLSNDFKTAIQAKYKTSHILIPGFIVYTDKSTFRKHPFATLILSAYLWPAAIVFFDKIYAPKHESYYYTLLFDMNTGELKLYDAKSVKMKNKKDVVSAMLSTTMYQIKSTAKK